MKKEDVGTLVQLLNSMKDAVKKLENAFNANSAVQFAVAKKEILNLQNEIDKII